LLFLFCLCKHKSRSCSLLTQLGLLFSRRGRGGVGELWATVFCMQQVCFLHRETKKKREGGGGERERERVRDRLEYGPKEFGFHFRLDFGLILKGLPQHFRKKVRFHNFIFISSSIITNYHLLIVCDYKWLTDIKHYSGISYFEILEKTEIFIIWETDHNSII